MAPEIIVVSTAFAPDPAWRRQCELSVLTQTIPVQHAYVDAAESGGACLENVYAIVRDLDPSTIVLWLDGDDWFAHDRVVEQVLARYAQGAWMTWGQYARWEKDRIMPGHCHDSPNRRKCRQELWYASHLRTFRAGLFQQIDPADFAWEDEVWSSECCDLAAMWPMLEMADDRGRFIPDVLYVYNYTQRAASGRDTGGPLREREIRADKHLRSLKPYKRLEKKPW